MASLRVSASVCVSPAVICARPWRCELVAIRGLQGARDCLNLQTSPSYGSSAFLSSSARPGLQKWRKASAGTARAEVEAHTDARLIKVVGISGSFRKASWHLGLLRAAQEVVAKSFPDLELEVLDISALPYVNMDIPKDDLPEEVNFFRAKVDQADAVLFSAPEYNYSIPGVLKNAIDWGSYPSNVWGDKAAAIVSAGGSFGGGRGQNHLRQMGIYIDIHFINKPEVFIRGFEPPPKFDQNGDLVDSATRDRLKLLIENLRAFTIRLQKK